MTHGGKREGAGRKPGLANRLTREIADRASAEGITPLEVMLKAMRIHANEGRWDEAADVASKAAPYMHPRLQNIDVTSLNEHVVHEISAEPLTTEQWAAKYCDMKQ